ncbi:MAG: hypothetical protein AABW86_00635 [Candidatus Micrarchaeota archaeon]
MNKKTRRRIMALQATRVRGGINETTSRQRDGERTLGQVYARLFDDNGKIKVEPPCGKREPETKRVWDEWADK